MCLQSTDQQQSQFVAVSCELSFLKRAVRLFLKNLFNNFNRFVALGNDHLQSIMMNDPNWMSSSQSGINFLVQRAMTILMQVLRLRAKDARNFKASRCQ